MSRRYCPPPPLLALLHQEESGVSGHSAAVPVLVPVLTHSHPPCQVERERYEGVFDTAPLFSLTLLKSIVHREGMLVLVVDKHRGVL